jgi:hypothetical protein
MRRLNIAILFLCVMTEITRAQDRVEYRCSGHIAVEGTISPAPLGFGDLVFFASVDSSAGHIDLINSGTKGIQYYLVILDLFDSQDKYVLSLPVFNVDRDQNIPFDVDFKPWVLANWPGGHFEDIPARTTAQKVFFVPLATLSCPSKARVSMIRLRFQDKSEYNFAAPTVRTMPALTRAFLNEPTAYERWMPRVAWGTIQVDPAGHGSLQAEDSQDSDFEAWLRDQISGWVFSPSSIDGRLTTGEIPFILIIGNPRIAKAQLENLKTIGRIGPVLVLAAIPPAISFNGSWLLLAGSQPVIPTGKQ